jgi:hypothetical protein
MYRLLSSGRPGYLFDGLQFGRSVLIIPSHRTSARAFSFFVGKSNYFLSEILPIHSVIFHKIIDIRGFSHSVRNCNY